MSKIILTSSNDQQILLIRDQGLYRDKNFPPEHHRLIAIRICAEDKNVEMDSIDLDELISSLTSLRKKLKNKTR